MMPSIKEQLSKKIEKIEQTIDFYLPEEKGLQKTVLSAMNYSVKAGGKRLRPMLMAETYEMLGGADSSVIEPFMAAIEMIHTYSLIHDDLPALDNDALRRGMPTAHIKFGEAMAILAGDALLNYAFETAASAFETAPEKSLLIGKAIRILGQKAGIYGMIGGQVLDLKYEAADPSLQQLLTVHKLKTGALISAACILGCLAAGATQAQIAAASDFAYNLGIAFQIKDDILDITGTSEMLGKPVGSDSVQGKVTYATKVGLEKAQQDVELLTDKALESLRAFDDTDFLQALAQSLISRDH